MHLSIDKISNVMSAIRPFVNTKALNLAVLQIATIHINSVTIAPLFKPFAVDMAFIKVSSNLNLTIIYFFDAFAFNFVFKPLALIFLLLCRLFILAKAMKLAV
jgi:hypothetical protein